MADKSAAEATPILDNLESVLERECEVPALQSLLDVLEQKIANSDIKKCAIGIDANVVLRIQNHKAAADIIDYLNVQHPIPVVVPGQVLQEFWNNKVSAIDTVPQGLRKKFDALKRDIDKITGERIQGFESFSEIIPEMDQALSDFEKDNQNVFLAETFNNMVSFFQGITNNGIVPFVPRSRFYRLAQARNATKTPPGFQDPGDGDFFVWADFLYGLKIAAHKGHQFERVVFVTNDVKKDWQREGIPHPLLLAEVRTLFGLDFEVWMLDDLAKRVQEA